MNHQACFYEIKRDVTFGCSDKNAGQKVRLNLKINRHGKNILLYAKAGTSWEETNDWVTQPFRLNGQAKDFTGQYSLTVDFSDDKIIFGAIPYTTQSLKDVSAGFSIQYWADCVGEEEDEAIVIPPKPEEETEADVEEQIEGDIEEVEEPAATTVVEIEDTQPAQIEGCKPLIEALLKDGTCYAFPDPEGIQSTFDGYVETTVEGENANAIRSFITMDGTLDQFSQLGGVLAFSENLSNSLGLDAKQVQIVKV